MDSLFTSWVASTYYNERIVQGRDLHGEVFAVHEVHQSSCTSLRSTRHHLERPDPVLNLAIPSLHEDWSMKHSSQLERGQSVTEYWI